MDILLDKVTQQALNYAIRSGIAVTGGFAMKQCSRLLQSTPRGGGKDDLRSLQIRLESKIRIISPAIDMIELIAARGNTSLESAVQLTKDLRWEIQALGKRLESAAGEEELVRRKSPRAKSREQTELELQLIISDMRKLLLRIEDAVPLINLAITTSGVNLTTNLPATVSPSRLLQASTLLTSADSQYRGLSSQKIQVGPVYVLSMYMLFAGHAWRPQDDDDIRATTWKEVIHKARIKLIRVPIAKLYDVPEASTSTEDTPLITDGLSIPSDDEATEFSYQLTIIEDLDDDRVHSFEDGESQPEAVDGVEQAGIRDIIPVHQISKIFYADTGKILNIGSEGETNSPVLLLKRDIKAEPPRRMMDRRPSDETEYEMSDNEQDYSDEEQDAINAQIRRESTPRPVLQPALPEESKEAADKKWRLPPDLDPEWIAFEVYTEAADSDDESEYDARDDETVATPRPSASSPPANDLVGDMAQMRITDSPGPQRAASTGAAQQPIKTSLSLLEMLIRLTALQQFRQASHLTIEDELLNFFLEDSSTTGAGPNAEYRQRVRRDARRRLGFDPYDESPMKRRGESYIAHQYDSPAASMYYSNRPSPRGYDLRSPSVRQSVEMPLPEYTVSSPSPSTPRPRLRQDSTQSSPIPATPAARKRPSIPRAGYSESKSRSAVLRAGLGRPMSPLRRSDTHETADDDEVKVAVNSVQEEQNGSEQNESEQNESKQNESKQNETEQNESKQNESE